MPQHPATLPLDHNVAPGWRPRLPPSRRQAAIRGGIGALLLAAAVLCMASAAGFPHNAPVEQVINFGLGVDLGAAGIALLVFGGTALGSHSQPVSAGPVSPLAIAGAIVTAAAVLGFATTIPNWLEVLGGSRGRFDGLTFGLFIAGIPWATGLVLSAVAVRKPGRASRTIAGVTTAVGALLAVPAIAATMLYSAGITD